MTSTIPYFKSDTEFISVKSHSDTAWVGIRDPADISWRLHTFIFLCNSIFSNKSSKIFVECGTGKGYMALALTKLVEINKIDVQAYLIDTFESDLSSITGDANLRFWSYADSFEEVYNRFNVHKYCHLVKGKIPQVLTTLPEIKIDFLHIDLNHAKSEVEALDFLLPKMNSPSFILLDDYAFHDRIDQGIAMNQFAKEHSLSILTLGTGQGVIYIK
jgi:predicted O-methyltransferase YrrM